MANFSHTHFYSASLHYPMSVRAIDPVFPQAISPMRATLFPPGMLYVTNITSINCSDTLFSSELSGKDAGEKLSGKHADESFMPLQFIVFEIASSIF